MASSSSPIVSSPKLSFLSTPMRHIRRLSRGGRMATILLSPSSPKFTNNKVPGLVSSSTSLDDDPGGVFVSTRSLLEADELEELRKSSASTDATFPQHLDDDDEARIRSSSWRSCDGLDYHQGEPLIVAAPESDHPVVDPAAELGLVLAKSGRLPKLSSTSAFASNHVMVNNERISHMVAPLVRLSELDAIARVHAEAMAQKGEVFHSTPGDIRSSFCRTSRRLGENVARGSDIKSIHASMMKNVSDKNNMLDRRYTNMGMATAKGNDDGLLYLVQVFRG